MFVNSHKQYGVVRKLIKSQQEAEQDSKQRDEAAQLYEVRLSSSLENVIVEPGELRRVISIQIRIHSFKGGEAQNIRM